MSRPGLLLVAFAASFAAYAVMAAPGVEWMDSGELTAAAYTLGGAHPPGHPAHTLLGKLATLVPVGEIAFRINLLSALAMAAAVAGAAALARALVPGAHVAAGAAAALCAASPLATTNATRAEVYAPVAALLVWAAVATVRYLRDRDRRAAVLAAFGCAAAAAFHPVIALAAALPMAISIARAGRGELARLAPWALGAGALALAAYAYLPVRAAAADPPLLMWGDPTTAGRFVDLISAPAYRDNFALDGWFGRFAGLWLLVGEGPGLGVLLPGLGGLAFAAITGLRGAGTVLASAAVVVAGAATQQAVNPDMPGYTLPALVLLSAGIAPLVAAIAKLLPKPVDEHPAVPYVVLAPIVGLALAGPVHRADDGGARRTDDPLRHWDATVARVPPGPAIYFANSDHSLFPAQYERFVAGQRPDVALANRELVRDIWFLEHLDRALPALYVPFVDDLATDSPVERLAAINMRAGRYVGGDEPAFGQLRATHAAPHGLGWRYAMQPIDSHQRDAIPPPPPDYAGGTGRRVAGKVGLTRAVWEAERGRLDRAARAAGLSSRFSDHLAALAPTPKRPHVYGRLPAHTDVLIFADWQAQTLGDDLAWRAGLDTPAPEPDWPLERRLLAAWHALLDGEDGALDRVAAFGRDVELQTARMLFAVGRPAPADDLLQAMVDRDTQDTAALILLGSLRGNTGRMQDAARLFREATRVDPENADAFARLGTAQAKLGQLDDARRSWERALELDPKRQDVAAWLRSLRDNGK